MSAMVEMMFSAGREKVWHNLGIRVPEAVSSEEAIRLAGLDWSVNQQPIFLADGTQIKDNYANVRSSDGKALGIVGSKYKIVQNTEAFAFTDELLGEGVKYETAGSLKEGKVIWLLAKMPETFEVLGDKVEPYLVFTNTHDGSGAVRVCATNIRVVCSNTLNMALRGAKRVWSARHTGSITSKLDDARETLQFAKQYIKATQETFEELHKVKLNDISLYRMVNDIVPVTEDMSDKQKENQRAIQDDILFRYREAPDLKVLDQTGARLVQAVADTTSHMEPFRLTANWKENRFKNTLDGNKLLDKTVGILLAA
jgi:phage/plasmid-like protein (TIGR03299 family)